MDKREFEARVSPGDLVLLLCKSTAPKGIGVHSGSIEGMGVLVGIYAPLSQNQKTIPIWSVERFQVLMGNSLTAMPEARGFVQEHGGDVYGYGTHGDSLGKVAYAQRLMSKEDLGRLGEAHFGRTVSLDNKPEYPVRHLLTRTLDAL